MSRRAVWRVGQSLFGVHVAYTLLETFEAIVKRRLTAQGLLNVDETGININGKLHWLH